MKSMLHEASSIVKAIEKAWAESGKPSEFSIKILEKGEKNFIGLTKRPAIVSITYGFSGGDRGRDNKNIKRVNADAERNKSTQKVSGRDENYGQPQDRTKHMSQNAFVDKPRLKKDVELQELDTVVWNTELIHFCVSNLKDIFTNFKFDATCSTKVSNKLLTITLDKPVTIHADDLKMFCSSIAHLLLQFLKKKYKKKFNGFQILINLASLNESQNTSKPN